MELLLVPVPLFDRYMSVEAYLLRYRFTNQSVRLAKGKDSPLLRALKEGGMDAFAGGEPIFVPITRDMLPQLADGFSQAAGITTLLLEGFDRKLDADELEMLVALKQRGFTIAVEQSSGYVGDEELLKMASYVLFAGEAMHHPDRKAMVIRYGRSYRGLETVATELSDNESFQKAMKDGFLLFEGMFYRIPVARSDRDLAPIKANLVQLLNLIREDNFEFKDIAEAVRLDPALSYSLMRFINSPYLGIRNKVKSIQHAVTILGQDEVRKWVTAAVFKALCADKPSELTRMSLIRAKLAEDLAESFGLGAEAASLFLVGMFSSLDVMLDTTMEGALSQVLVSDEIADALTNSKGRFYTVLQFVLDYERADWDSVLTQCAAHSLAVPRVFRAYMDAVGWYHELITARIRPQSGMRRSHGSSFTTL